MHEFFQRIQRNQNTLTYWGLDKIVVCVVDFLQTTFQIAFYESKLLYISLKLTTVGADALALKQGEPISRYNND